MSANKPTGMGNKTNVKFNRVANDIWKFANYKYDENDLKVPNDLWENSQNTIKARTVNNAPKPTSKPTVAPVNNKRRAPRKAQK